MATSRTEAPNWIRSEYAELARLAAISLTGFFLLWFLFFGIFKAFPYFSSGADVVYRAKVQYERSGNVFPSGTTARRLVVFGNSSVLSGFIPDEFDRLAAAEKYQVYSFNSGFPARDNFVPQLKMLADRGQAPDILLLTTLWKNTQAGVNPFNLVQNDHDFVEALFPFRYILRDFVSFLLTSRSRGGPAAFYASSRRAADHVIQDRGYYFISEQTLFPDGRLPDDFHLESDKPGTVDPSRQSPSFTSGEFQELRDIIAQHHIACYYIPYYSREGSFGKPPERDDEFARAIDHRLDCKVLGPRYFAYPPRLFSDPKHVNPEGARIYTRAIYQLLAADWDSKH